MIDKIALLDVERRQYMSNVVITAGELFANWIYIISSIDNWFLLWTPFVATPTQVSDYDFTDFTMPSQSQTINSQVFNHWKIPTRDYCIEHSKKCDGVKIGWGIVNGIAQNWKYIVRTYWNSQIYFLSFVRFKFKTLLKAPT